MAMLPMVTWERIRCYSALRLGEAGILWGVATRKRWVLGRSWVLVRWMGRGMPARKTKALGTTHSGFRVGRQVSATTLLLTALRP